MYGGDMYRMCRQRESLPGRTEAGAGTDAGLGVISEGEGNYDPHHDGEDGADDGNEKSSRAD